MRVRQILALSLVQWKDASARAKERRDLVVLFLVLYLHDLLIFECHGLWYFFLARFGCSLKYLSDHAVPIKYSAAFT